MSQGQHRRSFRSARLLARTARTARTAGVAAGVAALATAAVPGLPGMIASAQAAGPSPLQFQDVISRLVRPGETVAAIDAAQQDTAHQDHARLVVRTSKGKVVFRRTFLPTCEDQEGPCTPDYDLRWDGRNNAGVLQPSRVYRATGYFVDTSNRTLTVNLGGFSVQHLVTRTAMTNRNYPQDEAMRNSPSHAMDYDVTGACSSVDDDADGTSIWMRSLSQSCPNPQTGDDVVDYGLQYWGTFGPMTVPAGLGFDRLMKIRFEVYGESGSPGDTLTVGVQNSASRTANTFVDLPGTISGGVGWHALGTYTVDPAVLGQRTEPAYRLQVDDGSTFHVRFLRATYTIRAWKTA